MTALSILHMNMALARREQGDPNEPIPTPDPAVKYFWIERKAKRGETWILETAFWATEEKANTHFKSYQTRTDYEYRLREIHIGVQS
jgi:hypothetical protein